MTGKLSESATIKEMYFSEIKKDKFKVIYLFMGTKKNAENEELILKEIAFAAMRAVIDDVKFDAITDFTNYKILKKYSELEFNISCETNQENEKLWQIEIESDFETLAEYRSMFLSELMKDFEQKYCIRDEISNEICIKAYPYINVLENQLREYLLRFFVKKVGSKWWNYNSSDQLRKKSTKNGETRAFRGLLNMEIYNIDFVDLRELVTGNFPKMSPTEIIDNLDFILRNLTSKPETVTLKAEELKQNYLGNWEKFFAQHMEIKDFKSMWQHLYDIRCIVSHNSLITLKNFADLINYYNILNPKLKSIIEDLTSVQLSSEEKQLISELNSKLTDILELKISLSKSDVEEIIESFSFTVASQNIGTSPTDRDDFINKIEAIIKELSCIGLIGESTIQNEDSTIPASCWIKFDKIEDLTLQALEYGINIKAFK